MSVSTESYSQTSNETKIEQQPTFQGYVPTFKPGTYIGEGEFEAMFPPFESREDHLLNRAVNGRLKDPLTRAAAYNLDIIKVMQDAMSAY